jgi:CRISPR-associated protein Csb2
MPLDSTDESKRTKVFDAFVCLAPDDNVVLHWPDATLNGGEQSMAMLLAELGYFGRAESWCAARLLADFDPKRLNCTVGPATAGQETVRVLGADPESWNGWGFRDRKIVRPDPPWNLLAETADIHLERWSDPPGGRWVTYARPADCFAPRPAPRLLPPGDAKTEFIVARYVLDVAEGRRPLPLVTQTLPLSEEVRRQLGREYARVVRSRHRGVEIPWDDPRLSSPIIHGRDERGYAAKSHNHAFYLPTDEDGDGRIDHVTIYAVGRFSQDDALAIDRLRSLSFGRDVDSDEVNTGPRRLPTTHRLLLVGLDRSKPEVSVFGPAREWVSATPYVVFRHFKPRGKNRDPRTFIPQDAIPEFVKLVLAEDWEQRSDLSQLPKPAIEFIRDPVKALPDGLGWRYRSLQFRRGLNRPHDDGYSRPFGAIRLRFNVAVNGPICLGYGCHFGMGLFRPVHELE